MFFDALGVKYEYEPEGFKTRAGYYLPDFKVKCHGLRGDSKDKPFDLWIEVKGTMTESDKDKIKAFHSQGECVLIVHKIPNSGCATDGDDCESYASMNGFRIYPFNYMLIDDDYFAAYPAATKDGKFYLFGDDSNYINRKDVDRVEKAYDKARQARFEHGEKPNAR